MRRYTLGLFSTMYPPGIPKGSAGLILSDTTRGIFVKRMVDDLEKQGVVVKKTVKRSGSVAGYFPFIRDSLRLVRDCSILLNIPRHRGPGPAPSGGGLGSSHQGLEGPFTSGARQGVQVDAVFRHNSRSRGSPSPGIICRFWKIYNMNVPKHRPCVLLYP